MLVHTAAAAIAVVVVAALMSAPDPAFVGSSLYLRTHWLSGVRGLSLHSQICAWKRTGDEWAKCSTACQPASLRFEIINEQNKRKWLYKPYVDISLINGDSGIIIPSACLFTLLSSALSSASLLPSSCPYTMFVWK